MNIEKNYKNGFFLRKININTLGSIWMVSNMLNISRKVSCINLFRSKRGGMSFIIGGASIVENDLARFLFCCCNIINVIFKRNNIFLRASDIHWLLIWKRGRKFDWKFFFTADADPELWTHDCWWYILGIYILELILPLPQYPQWSNIYIQKVCCP